ncbi:serine/threonine protein kinase [Streptomyces sp. NBC_01343]|uniref:serine/threonine-protein kinase n=1 Tax=Streptomyces sp. NBC_01343 TaxID=2903832 RepID=UPI002E1067E4|nr:serine/threonine protein kinase [Streptomyces sp. NBC_01343]
MAGPEGAGPVLGGRYRLVRPMGSGGSGRTWEAYDELLGTRVVARELRAPWTLTDAELGSWLRWTERQVRWTAGSPRHPNLVPVHDLVVDGPGLWTVMEFAEGQSLAARLEERGPLSTPEAARVATALLVALQAAHEAMFVHGAVRPENVMLDGDRVALLIDPETATHAGDHGDDERAALSRLVRRVDYLAPERIQGLPQQPASDLYALGVTLYEAVEGISPFRGHSPAAILAAVLNQPPPPMERARSLEPLIEGLLRKDPAARLTLPQAWQILNPSAPVGEDVPARAMPTPRTAIPAPARDYARAQAVPEPASQAVPERAPRAMPGRGPLRPPPTTASGGNSALFVAAVLLLALVAVCVLLARPVLDYAGSLAAASLWPAVLPWLAFVLGLLLLGHQVRSTVRLEGSRHPLRSRLSLVPPPPWSPQELAARREAAERSVEESLLRVDQRLAAASPRLNRKGGIDA